MGKRTEPPFCHTMKAWLQHHCGRDALAPLTGQDYSALKTFAHLLELYARADEPGSRCALKAMAAVIPAMQEKNRELCKRLIPHVLDWANEDKLWSDLTEMMRSAA